MPHQHSLSSHTLPLSLPARTLPILHLPLPNIPSQASTSIRTHLAAALKHDAATRPPARARKTTPPVVKGYVPVDQRPLPPRSLPRTEPVVPGGSGSGMRMDPVGFGTVFGVEVGARTEGYEQGAMAGPSVASVQGTEGGSSWQGSVEGSQYGMFEIVDPITSQLDTITRPLAIGDTISQPPLDLSSTYDTTSQPRAFPVHSSQPYGGDMTGWYGPVYPYPYASYSTSSSAQPPIPYYLASNLPTDTAQYLPSSQSFIPSQPIPRNPVSAGIPPPITSTTAPPSTRRNRIPTPIVIPPHSQPYPSLDTASSYLPTAVPGSSTSLLTANSCLTGTYLGYPEPNTPFLITPFDTTFPPHPTYTTPSIAAVDPLSDYQFGLGLYEAAQKFQPELFLQGQPMPLTSCFVYPETFWSDAGIPDLISSSTGAGGGMYLPGAAGPIRVDTAQPSEAVPVPAKAAKLDKQPQLQSSFLLTPPKYPPIPLPQHPPTTKAPSRPSPPTTIIPPKLIPMTTSTTSSTSTIATASATWQPAPAPLGVPKPSTPVKYTFPESYEFADLLDEGTIAIPTNRRLTRQRPVSAGEPYSMAERFGCDDCDETFTRPSDAARHKIRRHVPRDQWEFACHLCHKRFSRKDHLLLHIKKVSCAATPSDAELSKRPASRDSNDSLGRPSKKSKVADTDPQPCLSTPSPA